MKKLFPYLVLILISSCLFIFTGNLNNKNCFAQANYWFDRIPLEQIRSKEHFYSIAKQNGWNVVFKDVEAFTPNELNKIKIISVLDFKKTVYATFGVNKRPVYGSNPTPWLNISNIESPEQLKNIARNYGWTVSIKEVESFSPQEFNKFEIQHTSPSTGTLYVNYATRYTIHNFAKMDYQKVTEIFKDSSFEPKFSFIETTNAEYDAKVISQEVIPGTVIDVKNYQNILRNKNKIKLEFKAYKIKPVEMPDLTGKTIEESNKLLFNHPAKIWYQTLKEPTKDINLKDKIFFQNPKPGELVDKATWVGVKIYEYKGKVIVPKLNGLSVSEAQNKLKEAGLKAKIIEKDITELLKPFNPRDRSFPKEKRNTVFSQNIKEGTQLDSDSEVEVTVIVPKTTIMPDLKGLSCSKSNEENRKLIDKIGNIYFYMENEPVKAPTPDETITRTIPASGQTIRTLDDFIVYCGRTVPLVPSIVGMSEQQAEEKLGEYGLTVNDRGKGPNPKFKTGQVYSQIPHAGSVIKPDTKLSLGITDNESVVLPYLTAMSTEQAIQNLKDSGYNNYEVQYRYVDENDKNLYLFHKDSIGLVTLVEPNKIKQIVPTDTKIILYVNKWLSEKPVKVPDILFMKESAAVGFLKYAGLVPKITYVTTTSTELDKQVVSKSINPAIGTEVKKGTEVSFSVYSTQSKVPLVTWFDEKDAVELIERNSLKVEKLYKLTDDKFKAGKVAEQSPEKYTLINPGSIVKIVIWQYSGMVTVPNLVNQELTDQIKNYLKEKNLNYNLLYLDTVLTSHVNNKIAKTEPAYNTQVKEGSTVNIYMYKNLEKVPDVVGKTEAEAVKILEELGFGIKKLYDSNATPGIVFYQSQPAGSKPTHAAITITIGKSSIPAPRASMVVGDLTDFNYEKSKIEDFYRKFKSAYESKNEYEILSLISNDWESGDDATISDLENHFRTMFKVFDSLAFEISNLQYNKVSENTYNVSYDAMIKGINYKRDIKHEEKSSINEQIIIEKSGKIKINKTLNGKLWYVD